jgi:hypothetical protein
MDVTVKRAVCADIQVGGQGNNRRRAGERQDALNQQVLPIVDLRSLPVDELTLGEGPAAGVFGELGRDVSLLLPLQVTSAIPTPQPLNRHPGVENCIPAPQLSPGA